MAFGRGELVGDAFIRITADTTAMRRDVKRAARAAGGEYASEFGQEVERQVDRELAGARTKIARAITTGDFSDFEKQAGSVAGAVRNVRGALDELRQRGELTNREFQTFTNTLKKWAGTAAIEERARKDADALKQLSVEVERTHGIALRMNRDFDKAEFDVHLRDAALHAARFNDQLKKTGTIQFGKQFGEAEVSVKKLRDGLRGVDALVFKSSDNSRGLSTGLRTAERDGGRLLSLFGGMNKTLEGIGHRGNPLVDLFIAPLRAGAALGSMFENLFGKAGLGKLAAGSPLLGSVLGLASGVAAALAAVTAMVKVASLLSAALSLVAGMATLAASAIGGGLVGAVAVLAGSVPAALAGMGALLLFMKDFSTQAPKATAAAKAFGTEFRKSFDARAFAGLETAIPNALKALQPLSRAFALGLGDAMNKSIRTFISLLSDPRMQGGLQSLLRIPFQFKLLADAAINGLFGLLGVFRSLSPFVEVFLDRLDKMAKRFNFWSNSEEGRRVLSRFFADVFDQADKLWQVVVNLGKAIGSIFKAATDSGNVDNFLDALVHLTDGFAKFLASTEGQNKLAHWFDQAWKAMQAVGTLLQSIGNIFGALNTQKAQDQVIGLVDGIGNVLNRVAPYLGRFVDFLDGIKTGLGGVNFQPLLDLLSEVWSFIKDIAGSLKGDALAALNTKFDGLGELARIMKDDLLPAMKPFVELLGSASIKSAAEFFRITSILTGAIAVTLAGVLNILDGIATLNWDTIVKGFGEVGQGIGKTIEAGVDTAFSASGTRNLFDKLFSIDSKPAQDSIDTFFNGFENSADTASTNATDSTNGFFDSVSSGFTDARLAVGKWFDDNFNGLDFPSIDFSGMASNITTALDTARLAVGQWVTDVSFAVAGALNTAVDSIANFFTTTLPQAFTGAATSVGEFFSSLPFTIATALGSLAGIIVDNIVGAFLTTEQLITDTVIPFFAALPSNIANAIMSAGNFIQEWWMNAYNGAIAWWNVTVIPFFQTTALNIAGALNTAVDWLKTFFINSWNSAVAWWEGTVWPWVSGLPTRLADLIRAGGNWIQEWWMNAYNSALAWWSGTVVPWFKNLPNMAREWVSGNITWWRDWFVSSWGAVMNWWSNTAAPWLNNLPATIQTAFVRLAINIGTGIGNQLKQIVNGIITQINSFISGFNAFSPFDLPYLHYLARGDVVTSPTLAMVGEAGREAVVPLDRPLSQVNPNVRELAAFAQGKTSPAVQPIDPGLVGQKTVNIQPGAFVFPIPFADPELVSEAVMDRIAEDAFI